MMSDATAAVRFENYLHFDGRAKEALAFYQSIFGGELAVMTWGDSPLPDRPGDPPADHVMHGRLGMGGWSIMACDQPGPYERPQGFRVAVGVGSVPEARRIFDALAAGGETVMPFQETFWSPGFGMVNDRFGTPWLVNSEEHGERA